MEDILDDEDESSLRPVYSWSRRYEHNFSILEQDTDESQNDNLLSRDRLRKDQLHRSHPLAGRLLRRGMIRYLYVVLDYSRHLMRKDVALSSQLRHSVVTKSLILFFKSYFDKNPLCQLGLICTRNGKAEHVCPLTGTHSDIAARAEEFFTRVPGGEASLENALRVARTFLATVPNYGSKELLVVYSSIGSLDPGNVSDVIEELAQNRVRCGVLGFGARLHILDRLCSQTRGKYLVPRNVQEFTFSLQSFTNPFALERPKKRKRQIGESETERNVNVEDVEEDEGGERNGVSASPSTTATSLAPERTSQCVPMGFPILKRGMVTPCCCHKKLQQEAYFCPRCNTSYCTIPIDCKICGLILASSFHIARSFHHLFPIDEFVEIKSAPRLSVTIGSTQTDTRAAEEVDRTVLWCYGCHRELPPESTLRVRCQKCLRVFCLDCDVFVHETLHNCPGCL